MFASVADRCEWNAQPVELDERGFSQDADDGTPRSASLRVARGVLSIRSMKIFLTANGFIVPFIALQTFYHPMIWVASLWGVTLPGSMIALALLFRRKQQALV